MSVTVSDETTATATEKPRNEASLRPGARGIAYVLGDTPWLLADAVPRWEDVWGRLMTRSFLGADPDEFDVRAAVMRLLLACHDLPPDEAAAVVSGADLGVLTAAVGRAFGPDERDCSYSDWVLSSLHANGIDPDRVPPHLVGFVLEQLVETGRAVPAGKFVSAAEAAAALGGR